MTPGYIKSFHRLVQIEGYKSDRRTDPGGYTVWGISSVHHPEMFVNGDPTFDEAREFFHREFWKQNRCDEFKSDRVQWELFEASVLCGWNTGARFAQSAYNAIKLPEWNALRIDGDVGPLTVNALNRATIKYERHLVKAMNVFQGMYLIMLNDADNIRGWIAKRVEW